MAYLAQNPTAQDTLEGIAEWWLLQQRIVETTSAVAAALERLVEQGKLSAHTGRDGRVHYKVRASGDGPAGEKH